MDKLQEILARLGHTATSFDPKELARIKAEDFNKGSGTRNEQDGYDCKICNNKALVAKYIEYEDGSFRTAYMPCKCEEIRISILRMKRSGLKDIIKDYTFDKFETTESWQKSIKSAAMEYVKNPVGWFFLGGQSGAGKTHLCTAICREFLLAGRRVRYMLWRDEIVKLKSLVNDSHEYQELIDTYKKADVLYIDDLFKTGKGQDNSIQKPTGGDVNVAFEIINYRYNNPELLTIISSECTEDELIDIDEAIGGRIYERAKSITIAKNRARNYRIKKAVTI